MTDHSGLFQSIILVSPKLFWVVIPILVLLAWNLLVKKSPCPFPLTGLEYLRSKGYLGGKSRKRLRTALWCLAVIILGIAWTNPVLYSSKPLFGGVIQDLHKNFIVVFDMSPSMNLPVEHKGFGGDDLKAGAGGVTRYENAREALVSFLDRFQEERFGLILFSTEPFLARWPTLDTSDKFMEILSDSIRRGSGTQLEAFSSLTNIDKALDLARTVFNDEDGAIILISDAEDDLENLGSAIRNLRENNIRLYTIGVGIPGEVIDALSNEFKGDPGVRIFQVDSEQDMTEAYQAVGEVEESDLFARQDASFRTELRWVLSLLLAILTTVLVWLDQTLFHQSRSSTIRSVD